MKFTPELLKTIDSFSRTGYTDFLREQKWERENEQEKCEEDTLERISFLC